MKKILPFVIALSLLLCACASNAPANDVTDPAPESTPQATAEDIIDIEQPDGDVPIEPPEPDDPPTPPEPSDSSQVEMRTEFERYPVGTESVTLIITNNSDETFYYGAKFFVQMLSDDEWVNVPFNVNISFPDVEYSLDPAESREHNTNLLTSFYDYAAGKYRIINDDLTAEFELE